ncbi:hypothetical protein K504DRAFT_458093 [Pleomassaria siparia CBS 279.74]|uniref:Uncharacterized protein n=1 Tax=Pleomassaria siparia CBS 279.74 TaxID=1314801 RepID=A0A6G1K4Z3_9PLEO|nr:hypothetical protein K504DRAFT_458093 [Pleomassaria siparia CBS 279.74]
MAPRIEDHWLWLGLGVFTFIAIRGVSQGLQHIVTLTTVHQPVPFLQPSTHPSHIHPSLKLGKQDAIKTTSLSTLASCTNIEIRKAATKILCERFFAHGPSRNRLLNDLSSTKPRVRHRAKLAFALLCEHDVVQEVVLPPTPRALRSSREQGRRRLDWMGEGEAREPERRGGLDDSVEERDLRRRRREAMVINEGDRPVSLDDVWMRDGDGRMSTDETLTRLI